MENYPQLVPLVVLIPAIGAIINMFWGARLTEKAVAIIGTTAAALTFVIACLLLSGLQGTNYQATVVNAPFLETWIRIPGSGLEIAWQQRVDTLSVTMMMFVTGVGSLIHLYAYGYMHGDARFHRFFTYLNMFLAFMLILITGNNFLVLFVGWEGVGLCSFLLISFWFDKPNGVGWKNSLAGRKAFIVNRIGDFGLMMGIFMTFWTFNTLDFYRPGELANPAMYQEGAHGEAGAEGAEGEEAAPAGEGEAHSEALPLVNGEASAEGEEAAAGSEGEAHSEALPLEEGEAEHVASGPEFTNNDHLANEQLGVFGQAQRLLSLPEGDAGRLIALGPIQADIGAVIGLIAFFFLIGAAGKSAQIPLFVWLPDAMAGPTPVSALIHAATMVTAGVYLMVRSNVFFAAAPFTSGIVTIIGISTALIAGFIALGQWDIKRVLAYSTVSQLGFMVAAVGVGAYGAAIFHMVTHAFFKALLFLGSGSVIHGVEHGHHELHHAHGHADDHDHEHDDPHHAEAVASAEEAHVPGHVEEEVFDPQDMRNMGGLSKRMPITYITYLIGTLALAGIWPLAGFWSKDEILADAWERGFSENNALAFIAFAVLLAAAAFTAFYMWRQIEMVFHGRARTEAAARAPESSLPMVLPLVILAIFSVIGGFLNIPSNVSIFAFGIDRIVGTHNLTTFLEYSVANAHAGAINYLVAAIALALAIVAIFMARSIYGAGRAVTTDGRDPLQVSPAFRPTWTMANARLYWDEFYYRVFENPFNVASRFLADTLDWAFWHDYVHDGIIARGFNAIADILANPVDLGIIDRAVNGLASLMRWISGGLRQVQTGYVRTYAVTLLLGVVIVIVILLLPWIQAQAAGQ